MLPCGFRFSDTSRGTLSAVRNRRKPPGLRLPTLLRRYRYANTNAVAPPGDFSLHATSLCVYATWDIL
ncbi:hypothetical protein [Dendronalium sp. ChiSLP03b]|uniref:hypothetical protein n=1 Tax=Dendronalium sp. ChiSLP03b TaxID=3075381 RepID=UPI002AD1DFE8|nr:hypothetical protein [Dendronalium sp. ChiSLP03b]MDZ8203666.1 hypothetical protein [Dendronalium sp. ChiSLP03b]